MNTASASTVPFGSTAKQASMRAHPSSAEQPCHAELSPDAFAQITAARSAMLASYFATRLFFPRGVCIHAPSRQFGSVAGYAKTTPKAGGRAPYSAAGTGDPLLSFENDLRRVEEHIVEARRFVQQQKGIVVRLGQRA